MPSDDYQFSAIDSFSEKLLSSRYEGNRKSHVFFEQAYSYHPGTYEERGVHAGRDERSSSAGIDMGDKSAYVSHPCLITLGCSFTQMGDLPYAFNWPKIIEHTQGVAVNNCGQSSSGVNFQIAYGMDVMNEYGFPKKIYALFPNLDRAILPKTINTSGEHIELSNIDWDRNICGYITRSEHSAAKLLFPHSQDEFYIAINKKRRKQVPAEPIIFQSFLLIDVLETMCKASGIEFKFSTWHPRGIETFNQLDYESYVKPKPFTKLNKSTSQFSRDWEKDVESNPQLFSISNADSDKAGLYRGVRAWEIFGVTDRDECHHEPQTEMQKRFWVRALDGRHTGLHDQVHFAEHFLQKEITNEDLKKLPEVRLPQNY